VIGGGGLDLSGGNFAVSGCTVSNNTAVYGGGGVETTQVASLTISKSSVTGNQTTKTDSSLLGGGGLFIQGSGTTPLEPATISGCTISNNSSAYTGGGAFVTGGIRLTITGSTFAGDRGALAGGGLVTFGKAANQVATSVTGCTFTNDDSSGSGGGLVVQGDGPVAITATKVTGCTSTNGGGVFVKCYAPANGFVMSGCTVSGNTALTSNGGGIFIVATPDFHISGSSITNNWARFDGGGAYIVDSGGSVLGTTISGNAAVDGGGVVHRGSGTIALQVAKVHGNTSPTNPDIEGTFISA
jgi:hypothetical protein